MFQVTVTTGPSKSFDVGLDRVPVAGDYILADNVQYEVQVVQLQAGGGVLAGSRIAADTALNAGESAESPTQ